MSSLVKEIARLPSFVEYEGCTFILTIGREYIKDSLKSQSISFYYRLDCVDIDSPHREIYNECGSWEKPDCDLCNFLILYENIETDEELVEAINEIEHCLISIGIDIM